MDEKKSTVIDSCDRCNKKLIIERNRNHNVLPQEYKFQECEVDCIFKVYLENVEVRDRNSIKEKFTEKKLLCAECDAAFNKNLNAAFVVIRSFWKTEDE